MMHFFNKQAVSLQRTLVFFVFVGTMVAAPFTLAYAASKPDTYTGLVKCSGVLVDKNKEVQCNFSTLISGISSIINWMFAISVPLAVALFAYAGIKYMSGKEDNIKSAKEIFKNVAIGFILMLVAYTLVHTLVSWVVDPTFGAESLLGN